MCQQRLDNPAQLKLSIAEERGNKMRRALWEAKVAMYEAKHQSDRLEHKLHDRIEMMFASVERLFLDARNDEEKHLAEIEDALTVEYGPRIYAKAGANAF